jgi:hypothetical protein
MDFLKDLLSGIKERLSSPFFLSFIVVWIALNYYIVIPLVFYKHLEVQQDGYRSYLDLIYHNADIKNLLWKPLCSAILFSIIYPLSKALFDAFQAYVLTKKNVFTFWLTKYEDAIKIEEYKAVVVELDKEKAAYAALINSAGVYKMENISLIEQNGLLEQRLEQSSENQTSLLNQIDVNHKSLVAVEERLKAETENLILAQQQIDQLNLRLSEQNKNYKLLEDELGTQNTKTNLTLNRLNDEEQKVKELERLLQVQGDIENNNVQFSSRIDELNTTVSAKDFEIENLKEREFQHEEVIEKLRVWRKQVKALGESVMALDLLVDEEHFFENHEEARIFLENTKNYISHVKYNYPGELEVREM